jgi:hypothetical protein
MDNNKFTIPIVSYFNTDKHKSLILKENKNKVGIYRWNNLIRAKGYIGSTIDLYLIFSNYYKITI